MANSSQKLQAALLGSETLLGREVKEVIESRGSARVLAFSTEGDEVVEETDSEAVPLQPLSGQTLSELAAILVVGSAATADEAYRLAKAQVKPPVLIDCQGYLENQPEARIVAPLLDEPALENAWLLTVAHPVAAALVLVITRLTRLQKLRAVVANIFEPASERGKPGVSELHQQTTALLTFKTLKKTIFDAQVSFNLLPKIGEDAPSQLSTTEARIDRHLATLLSHSTEPIPMPSVRVMQAPVFHGYSVSLWVEFESDVQAQQIEEALASAQIEVRLGDQEPPDNVGAAGQSGLIAGDIRMDRNHPRAAWIWIVMDNIRVVADASADIIRYLPANRAVDSQTGRQQA